MSGTTGARRRAHVDISADTSDSSAGAPPVTPAPAAAAADDTGAGVAATGSSGDRDDAGGTVRGVLRVTVLLLVFGVLPVFLWRNFGRPSGERVFTPEELLQYNGENGQPIYLAIRGQVFDVTSGRAHYGKGTGYHGFAGRDGTRAFVTGCYTPRGLTHDLRGFDAVKRRAIDEWLEFYKTHKTYRRVGRVALPKIDPDSPLPDDCVAETAAAAAKAAAADPAAAAALAQAMGSAAAPASQPQQQQPQEPLHPPSSQATPLQAAQQRAQEATAARQQQQQQPAAQP